MTTFVSDYAEKVRTLLAEISCDEEPMDKAASLIAEAFIAGHSIFIFGCTHSALLAEDVFYRAGAPAFWRPLWGPGMNIASTPGVLTSANERNEELGRAVIECSRLRKDDVLLVISTSGKNAAPLAVAETALKRGVRLILLTSSHYRDQRGNHSSLANLWSLEGQAVMLDNHVPRGDAAIPAAGCPMGPLSTIAGSFILHSLSALAVEKIAAAGMTPPVFMSSNTDAGRLHNEKLLADPELRNAFFLP